MKYIIIVDSLVTICAAWHRILKLKSHECNESEIISIIYWMASTTIMHLNRIELAKYLKSFQCDFVMVFIFAWVCGFTSHRCSGRQNIKQTNKYKRD